MDNSSDADSLFKSAIDILSRDVPTPKYQGIDIKPVKREVDKASASRDASKTTIDESTKLNSEAVGREKSGYLEKAAAESEMATAEAARDAQIASKNDAFNLVLDAQRETAKAVAESSAFIIQAKPAADAKLQAVQEMQSVGFMDNPLEWAYNSIQLPAKIKDYNRDAQRINSAQDAIDAGLKTVKDIADGATKSVPNTTAAMAVAKGREAAAKAQILSAQADENLAKINVEFAGRKLAGDLAVAAQTENMTRLQQADNHARFQAQVQAIAVADTHANRLIAASKLMTQIGENQHMREVVLANYDRMTGREEGTTTLIAYNKMPPDIRAKIESIGGSSTYGQPYDALQDLRKLRVGEKLPEATKRLMSFLSDKEREHEATIQTDFGALVAGNKMNKADESKYRENFLNEQLKKDLQKELDNPDNSKLFRAPNPQEIIGSGMIKSDSQLGKMLEPLTKTTTPIAADIIATQIYAASKNATEAGAMLSQYYSAARAMTVSASNLAAINDVKITPGYVVYAKMGAFMKPVPFDISNPAEATRYMLINAAFNKKPNATDESRLNRMMGGQSGE